LVSRERENIREKQLSGEGRCRN